SGVLTPEVSTTRLDSIHNMGSGAPSWWKDRLLLFEFCAISFLVTSLLPENIDFNQGGGWLGLLVSRLEANAEKLTRTLPFGTRVLKTVAAPADWRALFIYHSIDRACIGHCFAFSNYEPSAKQFRLRVSEDSPVAVFDPEDSESMESGEYVVQPDDLPLKQIDQCDPSNFTTLCIRDLSPNEKNGRLSHRPL